MGHLPNLYLHIRIPMKHFVDNQLAKHIAENHVLQEWTKHKGRERVLLIQYVQSKNETADLFPEALWRPFLFSAS